MSAIDRLFQRLRNEQRKAFMPFITAGDPDLEFTASLLRELDSAGADLCELGIPYSDPIADGPVVQDSFTRALAGGLKFDRVLRDISAVLPQLSMPVVTMVSYAIIFRRGMEQYVEQARQAGFAGAIVPDLPVEEADPLAEVCRDHDFSLIQLITPTTPETRRRQIAASSSGFIYFVSVTGITGERKELPPNLVDNLVRLRDETELPICVGFGISRPEHVKMLAPVADGLIVGSAIVRRAAEAAQRDRSAVLSEVREYVGQLIDALHVKA